MNGPRRDLAVVAQGELDAAQAEEMQKAYTGVFGELPPDADASAAAAMERVRLQTAEENKPTEFMIRNCARCGCDHRMLFYKFYRPHGRWTHWGKCPITDEPVMQCTFVNDDQYMASDIMDELEEAFCRMVPMQSDVFGSETKAIRTLEDLRSVWLSIVGSEVDPLPPVKS